MSRAVAAPSCPHHPRSLYPPNTRNDYLSLLLWRVVPKELASLLPVLNVFFNSVLRSTGISHRFRRLVLAACVCVDSILRCSASKRTPCAWLIPYRPATLRWPWACRMRRPATLSSRWTEARAGCSWTGSRSLLQCFPLRSKRNRQANRRGRKKRGIFWGLRRCYDMWAKCGGFGVGWGFHFRSLFSTIVDNARSW